MSTTRSSPPNKQTDTIPLIDVIRILAAWMVLAWHTSSFAGYRLPIFGSGAVAVDVFMNVSGFLMVFLFWERRIKEPWDKPLTWFKFYIRRFFRITPLYYSVLLFLPLAHLITGLRISQPTLPIWQWLLLRFSFLFGFIPTQSANCIIPDWSLTLEMQFYACFPFLFLTMIRLGPGLFFFLCSLVGAVFRFLVSYYGSTGAGLLAHFPQPTILPLKLHVFAIGMLTAWVLIHGPGELKSKWFWAAFPVYLLTCKENFLWLLAAVYWTSYVVCCVPQLQPRFFILVQFLNRTARRIPWRQTLAECSYGTYLIHNVVISLVLAKIWPHLNRGQGSLWHFVVCFALNLGVTTIVSWASHLCIEKPGINRGRNIIQSLRRKPQS
jgi:peptidoglycan/LPS O-acetylase OafA/YrhL